MGVFPAASGNFLPNTWRNLMSSPVSVEASIPFVRTYVCLTERFCCRIHPSLTSTLRILLLISMGRSTRGRVSAWRPSDQGFCLDSSRDGGVHVAFDWL